jgi:hypothetical protein
MRRLVRDTSCSLATVVSIVASGHVARAETSVSHAVEAAPTSADKPAARSSASSLRAGVLAGVGFPRPLAAEGVLLLGDRFLVGAEYGALPAMTVDAGSTNVGTVPLPIQGQPTSQVTMNGVRVSLWSVAAEGRWFPFAGAFYLGLRVGRQHVEGTTTLLAPNYGSMPETIDLDAWFLNPRAGFLWVPRGTGFAFGMEAGVQLPVDPRVSSTMPLSLFPSLQRTTGQIGGSVLPTVDLIRLGFVL